MGRRCGHLDRNGWVLLFLMRGHEVAARATPHAREKPLSLCCVLFFPSRGPLVLPSRWLVLRLQVGLADAWPRASASGCLLPTCALPVSPAALMIRPARRMESGRAVSSRSSHRMAAQCRVVSGLYCLFYPQVVDHRLLRCPSSLLLGSRGRWSRASLGLGACVHFL